MSGSASWAGSSDHPGFSAQNWNQNPKRNRPIRVSSPKERFTVIERFDAWNSKPAPDLAWNALLLFMAVLVVVGIVLIVLLLSGVILL